jgi:hypothetical protein
VKGPEFGHTGNGEEKNFSSNVHLGDKTGEIRTF